MDERVSGNSHRNGAGIVRFGTFGVDLRAGELRKGGIKIKLYGQAFSVLAALLEQPGQVVTREELRQKLWTGDTFVDFEQGLNKAINKIREALGDSAENSRFVETLPRRGYRFIAPVTFDGVSSGAADSASGAPAAPSRHWRLWLVSAVACLFALTTMALAFLYFHRALAVSQVVRFEIPVPANLSALGYLAVSPDGQNIVFVAGSADGQTRLWLRSLETLEVRSLDGTDGAFLWPFWSPDSRYVAFFAQGKLKKIATSGGPAAVLCEAHPPASGGSWNGQDTIVFGSNDGTHQVAATGGSSSLVTGGAGSVTPLFLPDGRHFIYLRDLGPQDSGSGIYIGSLDAKPQQQSANKLLPDYSVVAYASSSDPYIGELIFVRGATAAPGSVGTLMAQRFDTRQLKLIGQAVPIAEHVSNVSLSVSRTGELVYVAGAQQMQAGLAGSIRGRLTWLDRQGKSLGAFGDPGLYRSLALSPDGKQVAFERADPQNADTLNLWLYDFARGVTTRFTFDSAWDESPVWSPGGTEIVFASNRTTEFDLYEKPSNSAAEDRVPFKSDEDKVPNSWSADGQFLSFYSVLPPSRQSVLPLGPDEAGRKPILVERSVFSEAAGSFSPNGRWMAYMSDESGKYEVYVRPFDAASAEKTSTGAVMPATAKWRVSKDGGWNPLWRRDGKELFYLSSEGGTAMAVAVDASGTFQAGPPKALFKVPPGVLYWDVSADGQRFLMANPSTASSTTQPPFTVVLNWQATLKK